MCCLQAVRYRGKGVRMLGDKGGGGLEKEMELVVVWKRRWSWWWSGKGDGVGGVGVMVKEELCGKVLEVRRISDSDDYCCF